MTRTSEIKLVVPFGEASGGEMVFELTEDVEVQESTERTFAVGPRGSRIRDVIDEAGDLADVDLEARRPFFVDLGDGTRQWRIEFERGSAARGQFGDGSTDPAFDADATERGTIAAGEVLMRAASRSQSDSRDPSALHIGEYGDSGSEDPFLVVIKSADVSVDAEQPSRFEGSITVQETSRLGIDGILDGLQGAF
jgi:hypothetical protein